MWLSVRRPWCTSRMLKVGLATWPFTPSPPAMPWTRHVFPAPRSPDRDRTSSGISRAARRRPASAVCASPRVLMLTISPTTGAAPSEHRRRDGAAMVASDATGRRPDVVARSRVRVIADVDAPVLAAPQVLRRARLLGGRRARPLTRAVHDRPQALEVVEERVLLAGVVQRHGRVEDRHDLPSLHVVQLAAQRRDARRRIEQPACREVAERGDDLGVDEPNLLREERRARRDLDRDGVAVVRRPALEHVGDVDLRACQADRGEQLVKELPCRADEGLALQVLVLAGSLADEHELRIRVTDTEDEPGPRVAQRAAMAVADVLGERRKVWACLL